MMTRNLFRSVGALLFLAVPLLAATPTIVVEFSWTTGESYEIGQERSFTVPGAERALVRTEILHVFPHDGGRVPRITKGLKAYFYPGPPTCPEFHVKWEGHCYPTEPLREKEFTQQIIAENGQAWRLQVVADGWDLPPRQFTIQGRVTVTFTDIFQKPYIPQFVAINPRVGEILACGRAVDITWECQEGMTGRVRIILVSEANPKSPQVIVADTENDGRFSWTPAPGQTGRFSLAIERLDGKGKGETGWFTIEP